jgi:hypothetical protein
MNESFPASNKEHNLAQDNNEIADSIKLEASALSPEDQEKIKNYAREVKEAFIGTYGSYASASKTSFLLGRELGIENRVLVLSDEQFYDFKNLWAEQSADPLSESSRHKTARYFPMGELIVMSEFNEHSTWIFNELPQDVQNVFTERLGSSEASIQLIKEIVMYQIAAHEIIHSFQSQESFNIYEGDDENIVWEFIEGGAKYYEKELMERMGRKYIFEQEQLSDIDFYKELLSRHGDKLNRLFFRGISKEDGDVSETFEYRSKVLEEYRERRSYSTKRD